MPPSGATLWAATFAVLSVDDRLRWNQSPVGGTVVLSGLVGAAVAALVALPGAHRRRRGRQPRRPAPGLTRRPAGRYGSYTRRVTDFVVITGLSGAGRSTAADVLEDQGWFVIDNMPVALMPKVAELAAQPGSDIDRVAFVAGWNSDPGELDAMLDDLAAPGSRCAWCSSTPAPTC